MLEASPQTVPPIIITAHRDIDRQLKLHRFFTPRRKWLSRKAKYCLQNVVVVNLVVMGGNCVIAQTSPSFRQGVPESTDARDGQIWKAPNHYRTVGWFIIILRFTATDFFIHMIGILYGSLWIPDGSKRTVVCNPLADDRTGRLFSITTASYTTPRWLAEKANLRKIS